MLLTLRGTPFLYYGEEIGMREEPVPRRHLKDPVGLRFWPFHPGRDGCRRPMAWNGEYSQGGGFTSAKGRHGHELEDDAGKEMEEDQEKAPPMEQPQEEKPWLPLSQNLKTVNVASQTDDPSSLLNFYKKCIWFRRQDEILRCGSQHIMMGQEDDVESPDGGKKRQRNKANETPKGVMAFVREYKSGKRLVLLNFSGKQVTVPLFQQGYFADAAGFQVLLSTQEDRPVAATESKERSSSSDSDPSILQGSSVTVNGNEGIVLRVWSKRRFNE
eukprot:Sro316_g115590.1 Neutral and basic amino acid transport protein rBAT (272) ;mRNA; f:67877-68692